MAVALTDMNLDELASIVSRTEGASENISDKKLPEVQGHPPLSYAQERLVFMDRLSGGNSFYNLAYGSNITGSLDVEALRRAWLDVVERHETLRSSFPDDEEGSPCVRFIPAEECQLSYYDLRLVSVAEQTEKINSGIRDMIAAPYSLESGPLSRGVIMQKGNDDFVFLYGFHHSVFDGWSQSLFLDELFAAYLARKKGEKPVLPALPASHGQYSLWQRALMESSHGDAEQEWWRGHLAGVDDLQLVTDKIRPSEQSFEGDCITFMIPHDVVEPLEAEARRSGASPFMIWTSIFAILLGRYSGQKSFAIGSSLAGRSHPDTESMIGFLVNNLTVRIDNEPDRSFREHLQAVQQSVLASYEHGDYPFQLVTQGLGKHPDLSRNPVYQATFNYQNYAESRAAFEGLSFSDISFPLQTTHVDLDIVAWPTNQGVYCCLLYATDLFTRKTAEAFCSGMVALSRNAAANPQVTVSDLMNSSILPDLSGREPSVLVGEELVYEFRSPWQRLLNHVEHSPDAPALILSEEEGEASEAEQVSFLHLAAMSSSFARDLEADGDNCGQRTVILLRTGVELFVAMFSVWYGNNAWLLVDPDMPETRMVSILQDVNFHNLVSTQDILDGLEVDIHSVFDGGIHLLPPWKSMSSDTEVFSPILPKEDDVAMLFCTSGSTGVPKIAPGIHRAVSHRLSWEMDEYPLGSDDLGCLKSSVSYADFFYEVFVPILSGVPLLLLGHSPALDVLGLLQRMERHGVTKMVAVPSLLKSMHRVTDGFKGRLQSLRYLRTSGEPMPAQLAESIAEAIPGITVYSVYGALEMHNPTSFRLMDGQKNGLGMYLPAGRILPGCKVALLDDNNLPVPQGERGEIHVNGWGVIPGYLTGGKDNCFPMLNILGSLDRWYKSGDMGYLDESGQLHIAGRKDFQIKVRGVRIEPEEVEGLMQENPDVSEAKVIAWEDGAGNQRLYGFVVLSPSARKGVDKADFGRALRTYLLEKLPAVMVPDYITVLEDWPHTATGKTHLTQLRAAFEKEHAIVNRAEANHFHGEEKNIAQLWSRVLGNDFSFDARTTFFKAGGNSLILINLHSELQKMYRREFPLSALFRNPTIESQVKFLTTCETASESMWPEKARSGRSGLRARKGRKMV